MNRLKLSAARWSGYTGVIGTVDFKDGISVDPVPRNIADRLSAAIQMVEVDEEGNEVCVAGVAHRLVADSAMRAQVHERLSRQSDAERKAEDLQTALKANKAPVDKFYTVDELQAVADEKGIKGLRVLAEPWNVRGKAIPALIEMIVSAQSQFNNKHLSVAQAVADVSNPEVAAEEVVVEQAPDTSEPETAEPETAEPAKTVPDAEPVGDLFANAAITGDMAAAINAASEDQPKE